MHYTSDILYVGQQINLDLQALSRAYPEKLSSEKAASLFNSYTTFLLSYAVSKLGLSVHAPDDWNPIYLEYQYEISYSTAPRPNGGYGGPNLQKLTLPDSAIFTAWVIWSAHMMNLSIREQELIVEGTGWNIPGKNPAFKGRDLGRI